MKNRGRSRRRLLFAVVFVVALVVVGCAAPEEETVVVYTSVDQVFSEPVLRACEAGPGSPGGGRTRSFEVRAVFDTEETKSTGILNRLIAEAENPQADVFWSGDPVRPFLLTSRGLVTPYLSAEAATLPPTFHAGDGTWTGLAARARVLLVNTELVAEDEMPTSIHDLVDPRWRGRGAIANPLFGTTTMHVAALVSVWGEERARQFLDDLKANEIRVASSNGEVKRLVATGEVAFGLTDTDDAHHAEAEGHPVVTVYPDQDDFGTLVMPTTVVLLRDGPNPATARRLIDCLLSAESEERLTEDGTHMPLRQAAVESPRAMEVDYGAVADAMEEIQPWLREWAGL